MASLRKENPSVFHGQSIELVMQSCYPHFDLCGFHFICAQCDSVKVFHCLFLSGMGFRPLKASLPIRLMVCASH